MPQVAPPTNADDRSDRFQALLKPVLLYPLLILVAILWAGPMLWMLVTSLKPESEIYKATIDWIPDNPTLDSYRKLFADFPVLLWFRNSIIVSAITTFLTVFLSALAAYPLARMKFRGGKVVLFVLLSTFLLPYELMLVPLFLGLNRLGISDTFFSLSVPPVANALPIFILTQFFRHVPKELEEAAIIDGCSRVSFFFRILLPLAAPALATVTILTFVTSWNNFFWPLIVSNSVATETLPVGIAKLVAGTSMSSQQGVIMASAVVATVPAIILFLLLQKHFVKSVASTGIRG